MRAFFEDQADPTLQGLLLIGEAGSGKSALAATVVAEYASSFATIAHGAAYPSLQHLPFGLITGLIQSLLGLPAPFVSREELQEIETALAPLLGEQWGAVRPALHYLLHSPETGAQARLRLLPADQLRHQLFWALRQLVKTITQKGPILLFVENLQWADDQSLDFLSSLPSIETATPVRLVGTTWEEGWQRFQNFAQAHHTENAWRPLEIGPLGDAEGERFIRALFPDLPEEDRTRILAASQGNLLYLQGVAEEFELGIRDRSTPLPASVADLFLHRLQYVPETVRSFIQLASVIGSPVDIVLAQAVAPSAGLSASEVETYVQHAQTWGFLQREQTVCVFRSHVIEQALYVALDAETCARWHFAIARAIERVWPAAHPWRLTSLATHYQRSAHSHEAIRYLLQAGESAAQQYANREAVVLLTQAYELAQKHQEDLRTLRKLAIALGDALFAIGEYDRAEPLYKEVLAITERLAGAPPLFKAEAYRLQGRISEVRGQYEKAIEWFRQAYAFLEERERSKAELLEKARICSDLGLAYHRQGLFKEAETWLQAGLALAMTAEDDLLASEILRRLGPLVFSQGNIPLAAHYLEQALQIQQSFNNKYMIARTLVNLGACYNAQGKWRKALHLSEEALQVLIELGDFEGITAVNINIGQMFYRLGKFNEAKSYLEQAIQIAQKIKHNHFLAIGFLNKALLHLYCNDLCEALEAAKNIPEITPMMMCRKSHVLSEVALRKGALEDAQEHFARAEQLLQQPSVGGSKISRMYHHRLKGLLEAAQGKFHHALAELQMAIDLAPDDYEKAFFLTEAAELAHTMGDREFAMLFINQAHPLAETLEAEPLLERLDAIMRDLSSQTIQ